MAKPENKPDNQQNNEVTGQPQPSQTQSVEEKPSTASQDTSIKTTDSSVIATKPRKPLAIGLIAAGALGIITIVGLLAYNLWYQNPDKVVTDSLLNAGKSKSMTADGQFVVEDSEDGVKATVKLSTQYDNQQAKVNVAATISTKDASFDIKGDAQYGIDGDLYVRVVDVEKTVQKLFDQSIQSNGQMGPEAQKQQAQAVFDQQFKPIIKKIDNNWIKISSDDLKSISKNAGNTQQCLNEAKDKLQNDKATAREVASVYKENRFIIVDEKIGSMDGSLGYKIKLDKDASEKFSDAFEETSAGKEIKKCLDDNKSSSNSTNRSTLPESDTNKNDFKYDNFEIWVSRWSHELKMIKLNGSQDGTNVAVDMKTNFNEPVTIDAPKNSITLKQLQQELEGAMMPRTPARSGAVRAL